MNLQTNYIQRRNQFGEDYRISYSAWGNPQAPKTLLCVHGLNRNSRDFDFVANCLRQDDYYIVAPDLPGRGNSDYLADPRGYSLASSLNDLSALIEQLQLNQLDFLGVSLGGILGILIASQHKKYIRRLILSDIGAEVDLGGITRIAKYSFEQTDFTSFKQAAEYLRSLSTTDGIYAEEVWQHMLLNSLQKNSRQHWELKRDIKLGQSLAEEVAGRGKIEFWSDWEQIKLPTLVIHGLKSDLLSLATLSKMQTINPQTVVLTVADAGHSPYLYREEHLLALANFLNG